MHLGLREASYICRRGPQNVLNTNFRDMEMAEEKQSGFAVKEAALELHHDSLCVPANAVMPKVLGRC